MVRIRNCISGAVALAASLLLAMAPALGQDHGFHGATGGRVCRVTAWARLTAVTPSLSIGPASTRAGAGGPGVGGAWVRPWGAHWVPHTWGRWLLARRLLAACLPGLGLPLVPGGDSLGYTTYWWGGVPYYYGQGVYYAWSPDYDSYVVTDPPPVTGGVAQGAEPPPAADSRARPPGGRHEPLRLPEERPERPADGE